ncbi:UNVERIFIED_CONTAM: hypothetical protein FKN15_019353 [Acipenser sinensis]
MEGRDPYTLTLYSRGYPSATVQWLNETGCDITERSKTNQSLDNRGLVELRSQMPEQRTENASYTFILNNTKLDQVIRRSFSVTKNTGEKPHRLAPSYCYSVPLVVLFNIFQTHRV